MGKRKRCGLNVLYGRIVAYRVLCIATSLEQLGYVGRAGVGIQSSRERPILPVMTPS